MLRRAGDLTTRARERIRAAREHDPHAWPVGNEDSAALMHELEAEGLAEGYELAHDELAGHEGADETTPRDDAAAGGAPPRWGARSPALRISTVRSAPARSAVLRLRVVHTAREIAPAG